MSASAPLRWRARALVPDDACDLAEPTLLAADSWLVVDGAVLDLDAHLARFGDTAIPVVGTTEFDAFWAAASAALPATGVWFPRVELELVRDAPRLSLRVREAPPRRTTAVLATWRGADPRTAPTVKGPDLSALQRLRTTVQPLGADEAVLLAGDGSVVEGAYSALLWWRGGVLHQPSPTLARIPSVTAAAIVRLADELGVPVRAEAVPPAELDGAEVWVCSALHGIRMATGWVDGPSLRQDPARRERWARLLADRRALA